MAARQKPISILMRNNGGTTATVHTSQPEINSMAAIHQQYHYSPPQQQQGQGQLGLADIYKAVVALKKENAKNTELYQKAVDVLESKFDDMMLAIENLENENAILRKKFMQTEMKLDTIIAKKHNISDQTAGVTNSVTSNEEDEDAFEDALEEPQQMPQQHLQQEQKQFEQQPQREQEQQQQQQQLLLQQYRQKQLLLLQQQQLQYLRQQKLGQQQLERLKLLQQQLEQQRHHQRRQQHEQQVEQQSRQQLEQQLELQRQQQLEQQVEQQNRQQLEQQLEQQQHAEQQPVNSESLAGNENRSESDAEFTETTKPDAKKLDVEVVLFAEGLEGGEITENSMEKEHSTKGRARKLRLEY
jgi:hypothetical protein